MYIVLRIFIKTDLTITLTSYLHSFWSNETYMEIVLEETSLRFHEPEGITCVKEGISNETFTVTH